MFRSALGCNRVSAFFVLAAVCFVLFLLERGAHVAVRDNDGFTALHFAAASGSLEVVRLLVERGAVVSATDDDGETARDVALEEGHTEVVEYLESQGG